jgi:hypothetical protein
VITYFYYFISDQGSNESRIQNLRCDTSDLMKCPLQVSNRRGHFIFYNHHCGIAEHGCRFFCSLPLRGCQH